VLISPGSPSPGEIDSDASFDAFERLGGPFGGRIRFVRDKAGDIWACEVPTRPKTQMELEADVALATMTIMAGTRKPHGRRNP